MLEESCPCPECGANLEWSAKAKNLSCPYCGTRVPWEGSSAPAVGAQIIEHDLAQALRNPKLGRGGFEGKEVQCQNCRAISVFDQTRAAQRCDFCGSPSILAHEDGAEAITPESLLPFQISQEEVRTKIRQWYQNRWFAPNRFKRAALTDTLHGVYLPYWTFDARASAQWIAQAGYYYYVTETYRDSQGRLSTRQAQRTRWEQASGQLEHFFDDDLVPGSKGVHLSLLRGVEPFPTVADLKTYDPVYVRGWTVERYQIDLGEAAKISHSQMEDALRDMCIQAIPGDTWRNLSVRSRYEGRTFKHILVPVWLLAYTYGRSTYQVVVNGYTGSIAGERPYSAVKITLAVLMVLMLVAAAVFFLR